MSGEDFYKLRLLEGTGRRPEVPPSGGYRGYASIWRDEPRKKTLGELFIEAIEKGEDPETAFVKFVKRGIQQPGSSKKAVKEYLLRTIMRAQEEGRI